MSNVLKCSFIYESCNISNQKINTSIWISRWLPSPQQCSYNIVVMQWRNMRTDLAVKDLLIFYYFQTDQCPELSCSMSSQFCRRKQGRQSKQLLQRQRCLHYCCCWVLNLALIIHAFLQYGEWCLPSPYRTRSTLSTCFYCANVEIAGVLSGSYWVWAVNIHLKKGFCLFILKGTLAVCLWCFRNRVKPECTFEL